MNKFVAMTFGNYQGIGTSTYYKPRGSKWYFVSKIVLTCGEKQLIETKIMETKYNLEPRGL